MIVLDTSVLSRVWRRAAHDPTVAAVFDGMAQQEEIDLGLPGIVLHELLACTRTEEEAARLNVLADALTLLLADRELHVDAARIATACARRGIDAGAVDSLIAAHTLRVGGVLFTVDDDFKHIAKHTGLKLYAM
jgi:predicted nucleic acid-binding protein